MDSLTSEEPPDKRKNTGVGSLSLLQGIFPTQELNWGLLNFRQIPHQLSYPPEAQKYVNHKSWRREVKAECKQRQNLKHKPILESMGIVFWGSQAGARLLNLNKNSGVLVSHK